MQEKELIVSTLLAAEQFGVNEYKEERGRNWSLLAKQDKAFSFARAESEIFSDKLVVCVNV